MHIDEATKIVKTAFPTGKIQKHIDYDGLYIFLVFLDLPGEENLDPFFSVNKETGELRDFSILTQGDGQEITRRFLLAD